MQNRYAGDVGDFGKLGLLRQLTSSQLNIGVNWYLAPDESHNADGKHIGYIQDTRYNGCDDSLRNSLKEIVNGQRSVSALETMYLVSNAIYYHEVLYSPSPCSENATPCLRAGMTRYSRTISEYSAIN